MAKWFKIVYVFIFLTSLLYPQNQNIKFEHLTVEDGLSSSRTSSILQDSKDFIWIATGDGLNKYDGYTFTVYRNDPADSNSLSSNNITHIYEDHEANLWISTIGGGLNKLDPETETFTRYIFDPNNPTSISSNNLEQTIEHRYDNKYILWVATGNGLNKFDFEEEKFTNYPILGKDFPYCAVEAIVVDSAGIVWTGYKKGGIYKFNPFTEEYTHYPPQPNNPYGLSGSSISWLLLDRTGLLCGMEGLINSINQPASLPVTCMIQKILKV